MDRYKTLLFDADGTLLDFAADEEQGIKNTFAKYGMAFDEDVLRVYRRINIRLWREFEDGSKSGEEILNTRFNILFGELGLKGDGVQFEKDYREELARGGNVIDGAREILPVLSESFDLYIVTNGIAGTQQSRLRLAGLDGYFRELFTSVDAGCQKPMRGFFEYCFSRIPGIDLKQTLIIGDSLHSDILGGSNAGIGTCWYNPDGLPNDTGAEPTFEITDLMQLKEILAREKE